MKFLIIEDAPRKYDGIVSVIKETIQVCSIDHAMTLVEGEDKVNSGKWDCLILDISMDIAKNASGPTKDGHANLGGMDILEQMYLLEIACPTIIVTGFDYFITSSVGNEQKETRTFSDIEKQALDWIGSDLKGCVRYGISGWENELRASLRGII